MHIIFPFNPRLTRTFYLSRTFHAFRPLPPVERISTLLIFPSPNTGFFLGGRVKCEGGGIKEKVEGIDIRRKVEEGGQLKFSMKEQFALPFVRITRVKVHDMVGEISFCYTNLRIWSTGVRYLHPIFPSMSVCSRHFQRILKGGYPIGPPHTP